MTRGLNTNCSGFLGPSMAPYMFLLLTCTILLFPIPALADTRSSKVKREDDRCDPGYYFEVAPQQCVPCSCCCEDQIADGDQFIEKCMRDLPPYQYCRVRTCKNCPNLSTLTPSTPSSLPILSTIVPSVSSNNTIDGKIIGGAVAAVAAVIIISVIVYCCCKKRQSPQSPAEPTGEPLTDVTVTTVNADPSQTTAHRVNTPSETARNGQAVRCANCNGSSGNVESARNVNAINRNDGNNVPEDGSSSAESVHASSSGASMNRTDNEGNIPTSPGDEAASGNENWPTGNDETEMTTEGNDRVSRTESGHSMEEVSSTALGIPCGSESCQSGFENSGEDDYSADDDSDPDNDRQCLLPESTCLSNKDLYKKCKFSLSTMMENWELMTKLSQLLDPPTGGVHAVECIGHAFGLKDSELKYLKHHCNVNEPFTYMVFDKIKTQTPKMKCSQIVECLQNKAKRNDAVLVIKEYHQSCEACQWYYERI
ncbi:uncharacterized protein [Ptychodera flava]|uniref:uncharacterized protein n=1 Tax=Ptychodera flava TaxID=63121 RepID=UPI00396A5085